MEEFIYTSLLLHKLVLYLFASPFQFDIREWAAFAVTTYSMFFLGSSPADLQVPNHCRERNVNSLFWVLISCALLNLCCVSTQGFWITKLSFFLVEVSLTFFDRAHFSSNPFSLSFCFAVDDVAPYFKMDPPQTQVHLEGNRLVLTCMAEGSWPLEFKWIYNGSELTRFSLEYRWGILVYLLISSFIKYNLLSKYAAFNCN